MSVRSSRFVYQLREGIRGWRRWAFIRPEHIDLSDALAERTRSTQRDEQNRIARHLHDTLGHDLALLCLKLDQLSSTMQIDGVEALKSEIESIHSVAIRAYEQIRSLLSELRGDAQTLSSTDWIFHVKECALLIGERAQFAVDFEAGENLLTLPPQMQNEILYLVREILRNIEKHARAKNVTLTLKRVENGMSIRITDDGGGFDVSRSQDVNGHHGLSIIQEIVSELNGSLFLKSDPAKGTQIFLWLPLIQQPT